MSLLRKTFLFATTLAAISAQAQSPLALTIEDFDIKAGETKTVCVAMQNDGYDVIAIEFKMQLPEGLSLASEPVLAEERIGSYTDKFGKTKASGKTVNYDINDSGYWIFSIFSMTDQTPFTGSGGNVLSMEIAADSNAPIGQQSIRLYDIELSTKEAPYYTAAYANEVTVCHENVTIVMAHSRQTFSCAQPLSFANTGLKAYIATSYQKDMEVVDEGSVTLTRVESVPARTGLFLVGTEGETYNVPYAPSTETYTDNMLRPVITPQVVAQTEGDYTNYLYGEVDGVAGFHKSSGNGTVAEGKAYLQLHTTDVNGVRKVSIIFGDQTTGINENLQSGNEEVHDLSGRKVSNSKSADSKLRKGVYIVGGKKAVVK